MLTQRIWESSDQRLQEPTTEEDAKRMSPGETGVVKSKNLLDITNNQRRMISLIVAGRQEGEKTD
jgi:hypothetical protein